MHKVQELTAHFDGQETTTLLHALRHYENYWSALVLNADHIEDREVSQKMVLVWREARKLRIRVEEEVEKRWREEERNGPNPMDIY